MQSIFFHPHKTTKPGIDVPPVTPRDLLSR